jgi:hypothetical protein
MIQCVCCEEYYPSEVMTIDEKDRVVCTWCAQESCDEGDAYVFPESNKDCEPEDFSSTEEWAYYRREE